MNSIIILDQQRCQSCKRAHSETVADCPLCGRQWKQAVLNELGVWDGLPMPQEENPYDYKYAAFVACGCGFVGPSGASCRDAIIAWNKNAALLRERLQNQSIIELKEAA